MMLSKSTCYTLLALLPFATKEPASYLKKEEILSQSMQLYCNTAHPDFCRQTKGGYLSSGQKALEWAIQQASTVQLLERISWGHYTLTQRGMWYLEDFSQQMALQETLQQDPLFSSAAIQTLLQLYQTAKAHIPLRQAALLRQQINCSANTIGPNTL